MEMNSSNESMMGGLGILRQQSYRLLVPFLVSLGFIACVANAAVIMAAPWKTGLSSPTLRMTVSLAVCDIWTSVIILFSLIYNSYVTVVLGMDTNACVALSVEMLRTGGMITSWVHLALLAFNHYISITRPFVYRKILTPHNTFIILVLIWAMPPISLFIFSAFVPDQLFNSPACSNVDIFFTYSFRLIICLMVLLPFLLSLTLYAHILMVLRRMRHSVLATSNRRSNATQLKRERKMLITTLCILATFLIGWAPATLMFIGSCQGCFVHTRFAPLVAMFLGFLPIPAIMLKSIVNPIIYAVRIPEIKLCLGSAWTGLKMSIRHLEGHQTFPHSQRRKLVGSADFPPPLASSNNKQRSLPTSPTSAAAAAAAATANPQQLINHSNCSQGGRSTSLYHQNGTIKNSSTIIHHHQQQQLTVFNDQHSKSRFLIGNTTNNISTSTNHQHQKSSSSSTSSLFSSSSSPPTITTTATTKTITTTNIKQQQAAETTHDAYDSQRRRDYDEF